MEASFEAFQLKKFSYTISNSKVDNKLVQFGDFYLQYISWPCYFMPECCMEYAM